MRKWKPFVKNSVSFHFPFLFILGAHRTKPAYKLVRQRHKTLAQQCRALKREQRGAFFSPLVRNGEDTVVLLFCCPVFFSSFIQSCKAAVWCHQSQSVCTSCTALIGCNDLRMSLHTLICFSLWPICFPILPWAAGCLPMDTQAGSSHAPFTLHYLTILCNHPASSPSLLSALWLLWHTGITYICVKISSTVHFFFLLLESMFVIKGASSLFFVNYWWKP